MSTPTHFHGWLAHDKSSAEGKMVWQSFPAKPPQPHDMDIAISHCGICGSDIHTLRSGWGATHYPTCVGHEIVGRVTRVGPSVKNHKVGDRVGVGAQAFSCLSPGCEDCSSGLESYCGKGNVGTYNSRYPLQQGQKKGEEYWSMGGYASHVRVHEHFAIRIPEKLKSEHAAPMMCGGITVWSPLVKNGAGPGKRVGIVGVGGLGHFGILFAKALGCDGVVAISRRRNKVEDAKRLGATEYIATSEDDKWPRRHSRSLDLIISTVSSPDMPLESYLRLLRTGGSFIQVGAPEDKLPPIAAFGLIGKGCKIGGSQIGSPKEIEEMLAFAAEKGIEPWVQCRSMGDANTAIVEMEDGKARYRYVLVNEEGLKAKI